MSVVLLQTGYSTNDWDKIVCVSLVHLLGVFQCGVSVVGWFQALHQAGVKMSAAFDEPPCHGKLLLQQFIECKYSWIEAAES